MPEALRVRDELVSLGHAEVTLVEGSNGIFDVFIDGKLVFSKEKTSCRDFPTMTEIANFG